MFFKVLAIFQGGFKKCPKKLSQEPPGRPKCTPGAPQEGQGEGQESPRRPQEPPGAPQEGTKRRPRGPKKDQKRTKKGNPFPNRLREASGGGFGSLWGRFWGLRGSILEGFLERFSGKSVLSGRCCCPLVACVFFLSVVA